jgi:prolyl oligopeptidase PreP (S9A serine peptidase family)
MLDVDALAAQEEEDWIWHGASTLPGSHDLAILSLSRGGSDASVLREFDISAKAFRQDGFYLPEAKGGTAWLGPRYAAAVQRLRARHGDHVGLLQDSPAVAPRSARGSGSHPA